MNVLGTKVSRVETHRGAQVNKDVPSWPQHKLGTLWRYATNLKVAGSNTPEQLANRRKLRNGEFRIEASIRRGHYLLTAIEERYDECSICRRRHGFSVEHPCE